MRVSYPLKDISTDVEAKNYFGHRNLFGKYPIGAHNAWHGGIHLEGIHEEIQCIADGRIIAYRFVKEYKKTVINDLDHLYSNGFILIQHDYKSKEKQKMTFYSLYHHLMPETDINKLKKEIPKFLSKQTTQIIQCQQKIIGLNARAKANRDIIKFVLPKGAIVTLDNKDTPDTHWSKKGYATAKYKKISYTDLQGNTHKDIYIATNEKYVTDIGNNQLKVNNTNKDKGNRVEKGEHLRETGNFKGKILTVVKPNTQIKVEKVVGSYSKVKYTKEDGAEQNGFIYSKSIETKNTVDAKKRDKIIACDIPIKAGVTIGYTGNLDFEGYKGYKATHIEVFTTDDVSEFLKNKKKDGKEELYFANIKVGTKLKTSLSYKVDIKANTPIKVLKIEGDYAQVKVTSITATLMRDTDINDNIPPHTNKRLYTIKNLVNVNKKFNGLVTKSTTFTTKQVKAPKDWRTNLKREVTFYPKEYNKKFWIEKTAITKITEKIKKELIIPEYLLTEEQKYDTVVREAKAGDKTTLNTDVCKAYIALPPKNKEEELTVLEGEERVVDIRKFKKVTDNNKDVWIKIVLDKVTIPHRILIGWIKEKDLDIFSAYNWEKFGFKSLNAGNEYIYSVKDLREATDNADFVSQVWDTIDTDGNKVLDIMELNRAFNQPKTAYKLSHLICKHKSEWSYTMAEIKPEIKELYDFGIQMEEDGDRKQKLETKRDDRLTKLETKIKELMFWQEASALQYTPPVKEEEKTQKPKIDFGVDQENAQTPNTADSTTTTPTTETTGATETTTTQPEEKDQTPERMFPSADIVHHFHPIAWVRQMKLVFGDNGICVCEARVRAFMRMLRVGEGTEKEIGYTTQYSGKQFSDMSKHPEEVITAGKYSSSAAGAYQIMRYTWWWLKGEKLKGKTKAGVYEKWHDYIKKYNIPNFNQESQDLLCLIIFKHKRKGMLNLIIKGKIKEATEKYGSYEWASLPPGQYGQPTQTMEKALKEYKVFFKQELKGQSDLHLKKGFLKKFGFDCCNDSISNEDEIENGVSLHFTGATSSESDLSTKTKNILKEVGKETKNLNIYITSTARTPYDQARIMYDNIIKSSVSSQKGIYASAGDKVIDVYTSQIKLGKSKSDIIKEMEKKIKEIGPSKVSKHIADPEVMNTFDIDYGLLSNKNDFWNGIKRRTELDTILKENKCYHIQINQ